MKKNINVSSITIMLLAVAVVIMSVGFATVFSGSIEINGTTEVKGASWNVSLQEDTYTPTTGSVEVNSTNGLDIGTTTMSYNVTLNKPGDFYEFTIDIKNEGTFNAQLTKVTLTELTDAQKKYLTYKVTYNGTEYTATTPNLTTALNSTASATVKVRVEYIQPANASDLPASAQTITLDASFDYSQVA